MRERLIFRTHFEIAHTFPDLNDVEIGKLAGRIVDRNLSELREPDEGMIRTGAKTAHAVDPYCRWTGADSFTTMIDHVRAGK